MTQDAGSPAVETRQHAKVARGAHAGLNLAVAAQMLGSAKLTPRAGDCDSGSDEQKVTGKSLPTVASWSTPRAEERSQTNSGDGYAALSKAVESVPLASAWLTPAARDWKDSPHRDRTKGEQLDGQAKLISGLNPSSSPAKTGKSDGFRLNPHFSLWLMGFPVVWGCCGARGMQSCRKSRRSSCARSSQPKRKEREAA